MQHDNIYHNNFLMQACSMITSITMTFLCMQHDNKWLKALYIFRSTYGVVVMQVKLHFLQISPDQPLEKTLVIYAKQRTGSTFTSSFFALDPHVTYLFEPLNFLKSNIPGSALLEESLTCNFSRALQYARHYEERKRWLYRVFCRFDAVYRMTADCGQKIQPGIWERDCRKNPYVVAKVITLPNVSDLSSAMERGQRVIVLLRDPRGVSQSRVGIGRYKDKSEGIDDVASYCDNMRQDLDWINRYIQLRQCKPRGLMLLRYEDLANDPVAGVKLIYNFLGRTLPKEVEAWTEKLISGKAIGTTEDHQGNFNVYRKVSPLETAWGWRKRVTWEDTQSVQHICVEYMEMAGYKMAHREEQLRNGSFPLIKKCKLEPYVC